MQITGGTVSITLGSSTVVGSSECDWSQVTVNNWFLIAGQIYVINASDNITKELTITPPFAGISGAGVTDYSAYAIVRDFTANHALPLLNPGDLEAASLWSRAMNIIDSLLGGSGGDTEIAITKASHGLQVGNVVYYDTSTGWGMAAADTAAHSLIIGVVSTVVDTDNFKIKTEGKVTGLVGFSAITPGTIYYLRSTATHPNLVSTAPSRKVPVMILLSDTEGYILSLAVNDAGVFALSTNGLVPGPSSILNKFLRDDGTWQASTVAGDSLTLTEHLKTGSVDWTGFLAGTAGLSLPKHILDLHTRVAALEGAVSTVNTVRTVYNRRNGNLTGSAGAAWSSTFNLPAGITKVKATILSGTNPFYYLGGSDSRNLRPGDFVWDALFGSRYPYQKAAYGSVPGGVQVDRPAPVMPNAFVCYMDVDEAAEVIVEVGPMTQFPNQDMTAYNYSSLSIGGVVMAKVCAGVIRPTIADFADGMTFYHAADPHHIIGELFAPFEFRPGAVDPNTPTEWHRGIGNYSGLIILEYGGYIEHSF